MIRKKKGSVALFSPDNSLDRNFALALFGEAAATPRKESFLRLVGLFERAAAMPERIRQSSLKFAKRKFREQAVPELTDGAQALDSSPFLDFAEAIAEAKRIREARPIHGVRTTILRLAEGFGFATGKAMQLTHREFVQALDRKLGGPKIDESQLGREFKRLGIRFKPDQLGRPKAGTKSRARQS